MGETSKFFWRAAAYPVAVHLGWNFTRFGAFWRFPATPWQAAEVFGFNTFEAHASIVCIALASCAITFGAFDKLRRWHAWHGLRRREPQRPTGASTAIFRGCP